MENINYKFMRVSGKSDPAKIAGALANHIRESIKRNPDLRTFAEFNCIGASSNNQAIKAVAICNGMLAPVGIQLLIKPAFNDILVRDEERTAMRQIIVREGM